MLNEKQHRTMNETNEKKNQVSHKRDGSVSSMFIVVYSVYVGVCAMHANRGFSLCCFCRFNGISLFASIKNNNESRKKSPKEIC